MQVSPAPLMNCCPGFTNSPSYSSIVSASRTSAPPFRIAKDFDEAAHQRHGLLLITSVVVHLPTAGLVEREFDRMAQPLQQAHDGLSGRGEERVVIAGDEKRDAQRWPLHSIIAL